MGCCCHTSTYIVVGEKVREIERAAAMYGAVYGWRLAAACLHPHLPICPQWMSDAAHIRVQLPYQRWQCCEWMACLAALSCRSLSLYISRSSNSSAHPCQLCCITQQYQQQQHERESVQPAALLLSLTLRERRCQWSFAAISLASLSSINHLSPMNAETAPQHTPIRTLTTPSIWRLRRYEHAPASPRAA